MTPTAATPRGERRLERTKILYLPKGRSPYTVSADPDTGKRTTHTNALPLYVEREGRARRIRTTAGPDRTVSLTREEVKLAREVAKKHEWTLIERRADIVLKPVERWAHLDGDLDCDAKLLDALERVARRLDVTILVRSGRRTMNEQWALYNELGPKIAAYPSASAPHVRGIAADCGIRGVNIGAHPGARTAMLKEGVCLRVSNENWHVELGGRDRWARNWLPR